MATEGDASTDPVGWPFIVGRGRTVGNRPLLAPTFLAEQGETSRLGRLPTPHGEALSIVRQQLTCGRSIAIAYKERKVTTDAIGRTVDGSTGHPLLDEHSRPIRVLFGIVLDDLDLVDLSETDLMAAWAHSMSTYRSFLEREHEFETVLSGPIRLTSTIVPFERRPGPNVVAPDPEAAIAGGATSGPESSPPPESPRPGGHVTWPEPRRRLQAERRSKSAPTKGAGIPVVGGGVLALTALAVVLAATGLLLWAGLGGSGDGPLQVLSQDPACEDLSVSSGATCDYVVTWTGSGPSLIEVVIEPDDGAPDWEIVTSCGDQPLEPGASCGLMVVVGSSPAGSAPVSLWVRTVGSSSSVTIPLPVAPATSRVPAKPSDPTAPES